MNGRGWAESKDVSVEDKRLCDPITAVNADLSCACLPAASRASSPPHQHARIAAFFLKIGLNVPTCSPWPALLESAI
jgi:hypothetical protein